MSKSTAERSRSVKITDHKAIATTLLLMNLITQKVQPTSIMALKDSSLPGARMQAEAPSQRDVPEPEIPAPEQPPAETTTSYSTPLTPPAGGLNTPSGEGAT